MKDHFGSPPLLVKPNLGDIYLAILDKEVSSVLTKSEGKKQHHVYYVSKILQDDDSNYTTLEKLTLTLITTVQKLKPYFHSHIVEAVTAHPIRSILHKPYMNRRTTVWKAELKGYGIRYVPKTTMKSQVLANFVEEFAVFDQHDQE